MEQIIKQCAGIDCAKKDFVVTFSVCDAQHEIQHISSKTFPNSEPGFKAFNKWMGKLQRRSIPLSVVMEATGVYHEKLAYFLCDLGYKVTILLPNRAKDFRKTLKVKKITDKIASQYLSVMGLEKKLDVWNKPQQEYLALRQLCREKERIQQQITQLKNQLEAEQCSAHPGKKTMQRLHQTLKLLQGQKKEILKEIEEVINANAQLKEKVRKVTTIPGVGTLTAATIIGETDGFTHVKNKRQLVSYAGYDIINHESGTSIKTQARISKRGNRNIRKALHMPALTAMSKEANSKNTFIRIVTRTGIKMKGVVAVQRKLLALIYTLWKTDSEYDPDFELKKEGSSGLPRELAQGRSMNP